MQPKVKLKERAVIDNRGIVFPAAMRIDSVCDQVTIELLLKLHRWPRHD
jgi:hypothetical protein